MLQKGDTIGVFSSSYPLTAIAPKAAQDAILFLERQGYRIKKGNLFGKRDSYRSGTIAQRACEFNELLYDPDVKCLMASTGGMVSNALLPYIDFEYLKAQPKIIIGYSDVTAILLGVYAKTGITTYYGPNLVTTFGQKQPFLNFTFHSFESVLSGSYMPYTYQKPDFYSDELTDWKHEVSIKAKIPNNWITVNAGVTTGRLIGGNLDTLAGIMASEYMPEFQDGDILFLEDTETFAAHAERYFSMLKICGVFDKVNGIILGKHRRFDDQDTGRTYIDILLEVLNGKNVPILAEVDCGHTIPMLTLPIG